MGKVKYVYNEKTCRYEPLEADTKTVLVNLSGFLLAAVVMAVGMIYLYQNFFTPVKEKYLKQQNQELLTEYEFLNKKINKSKEELGQLQMRDDKIYRTILDVNPIPQTVRTAGVGGTDRYGDLFHEDVIHDNYILDTYQDLDKLKGQIYIQTRSYDELEEVLNKKRQMWESRPAITPMSTEDITRIGSGFRWRFHPILKINRFHWGIDITADRGKPIHSSGDGVVAKAYYSRSYGNVVYIDHGFGYETRYAHMSDFNVEEGQKVKRGDILGFVGSTGLSSASHLHYEVLLNGQHIDPVPYLSKNLSTEEYEKLIDDSNNSDLILDY